MAKRKPSKAFSTRYAAAKKWRAEVESDLREVYSFCLPGVKLDFTGRTAPVKTEVETYHSLGEEVATDLAGDLVTYFTPAEARWASYAVIAEVEEDDQQAVLDLVKEREDQLFDMIQSSNYNDIAPQWGFQAATYGTPALWVERGHLSQPIHVEVVPPSELMLTPGYRGILDRFRRRRVPVDQLDPLFNGWDVDLSAPEIANARRREGASVEVVWGFWVDWSDPGRPMWRMEITVEGSRASDEAVLLGDFAGSCPLLVGRFNPMPSKPWGRGPGIKALPDLRVLDKIAEVTLTALDDAIQTTLIYPDDGFIDLSNGIEPGRAYPAGRGFSRDQIYELQKGANLDYGFYSQEQFERSIRAAFYQDGPRQRGETPPTASQWLDERRRVQQRLGKPSAPLWSEMIFPLVQRFEYLAVQAGDMDVAITHNGAAISVLPISPLQKAQNQDQVMVARSNLDLAAAVVGPEAVGQFVDPIATFQNIVNASGDTLTVINNAPANPPVA